MKALIILLFLVAGCVPNQIDMSCTQAHTKDGWLYIARQQIRIDKIAFVKNPFKAKNKRASYRIIIGVEGDSFRYDDNDIQACYELIEKITRGGDDVQNKK